MGRYEEDNYNNPNLRQKDLVLSSNEFCHVQNSTNGVIKTYTGPIMLTISQQESLVIFNPKNKRFEETQDFNKARQLFLTAPEGWYAVLKNPAKDNEHPEIGKAITAPQLEVGHKINVPGPTSFSLFPGQMGKVIRGHRLRSNQYLLARVYDAEAARKGSSSATMIDAEGNEVKEKQKDYFVGQLLVIKGTEVSFYIPPTGIEVIQTEEKNNYVRDAVTLERLEYAILKDEDGEKRYIHGPAVVFPEPTETFVTTPKGGVIFRALELSPISGIYVKVIAEYKDEKGVHPVGEELFITGKDQMIYYPRPEHALIQYDGKYMHHAIAIPEGEGRYILDRLTGTIKTVLGPTMYLPDPRTEVVVTRKLSLAECQLMYPGNTKVIEYNESITEKSIEKKASTTRGVPDSLSFSTANNVNSLAIFEANSKISRGTSYTKPRTITLDTKFDGAVSIDVWTGYAINVISKTGKRETVVGPTTRLLNYDETIEAMELSTGKPKTTDQMLRTGFLRIDNNKISDLINVQTSDFVDATIKVSYCVNFLKEYKDKWFNVENYVKYLCDHMRSLLKREVKKYTIQDFYSNSTDIIRNIVLNISDDRDEIGRVFEENGMEVYDVEVLSLNIDSNIEDMLHEHQEDMIAKTLELSDVAKRIEVAKQLAETEKKEAQLKHETDMYIAEFRQKCKIDDHNKREELEKMQREAEALRIQAKQDIQQVISEIQNAEIERQKEKNELEIEHKKKLAEIERAKQTAYADTIKEIMSSIDPALIAALTSKANADMLATTTKAMSPLAIANNESVAETTNRLLRGTSLEGIIEKIGQNKVEN